MDCTKKIISWLYGEGVNAQTYGLRIGELGQFVQSFKKNIDFGYVKREREESKVKSLHCTISVDSLLIIYSLIPLFFAFPSIPSFPPFTPPTSSSPHRLR